MMKEKLNAIQIMLLMICAIVGACLVLFVSAFSISAHAETLDWTATTGATSYSVCTQSNPDSTANCANVGLVTSRDYTLKATDEYVYIVAHSSGWNIKSNVVGPISTARKPKLQLILTYE